MRKQNGSVEINKFFRFCRILWTNFCFGLMRACLKIIFSHLNLHELPAVARVSREWCWNYWRSSDRDDLLLGALYKIFCMSEKFKWLFYVRHPKARQLASKGLAGFEEIRELYYGEFLKGAAKKALEKKHNMSKIAWKITTMCQKFLSGLPPDTIHLSENVTLCSSYSKIAYVFRKENHTVIFYGLHLNYVGQFVQYGNSIPYKHGFGKEYSGEKYLLFEGKFNEDDEGAGIIYSQYTGEPIYDTRKEHDGQICKKLGSCVTKHMGIYYVELFIEWEYNHLCKFCANEFKNSA